MSALTGFLFGVAVASIIWYAMIKIGLFTLTPKGYDEFTKIKDDIEKLKNKL